MIAAGRHVATGATLGEAVREVCAQVAADATLL